MNSTESTLRAIKDRIASVMGDLEEAAPHMGRKANQQRLQLAADELHRCANEMQNVLMRIKPRA